MKYSTTKIPQTQREHHYQLQKHIVLRVIDCKKKNEKYTGGTVKMVQVMSDVCIGVRDIKM